jgi:hypothetical protein
MMFTIVPLASAIGIIVMPYVHLAEWEASKANTPRRKHKGTKTQKHKNTKAQKHAHYA